VKPTIIDIDPNLSNKKYHARDEYSSSFIKDVVKYGVSKAIELKENNKPNKAMLMGSAWHSFIEGADAFKQEVAIFDDSGIMARLSDDYSNPRATNDYKAFKKEFEKTANGRIVLTREEMNQFEEMYESMESNRWVRQYALNKDKALDEYSYFWEYQGMRFRTRPDRQLMDFMGDLEAIVDWKSCRDALSYGYDIRKYRHDISAVMYCLPLDLEPKDFYFVATDKSKPYVTSVYGLSSKTIRSAYHDFHKAIDMIKHYEQTGEDLSFDNDVDRI